MLRPPPRPPFLRWLPPLAGGVALLWLSLEDNHVWPVALLGAGLAGLAGVSALLNRMGGRAVPVGVAVPGAALWGALVGLGANLTTAALMLLKNALHAHVFLDFPPALMLAMLARAPAWSVAGALIGLSLVLLGLAFYRESV